VIAVASCIWKGSSAVYRVEAVRGFSWERTFSSSSRPQRTSKKKRRGTVCVLDNEVPRNRIKAMKSGYARHCCPEAKNFDIYYACGFYIGTIFPPSCSRQTSQVISGRRYIWIKAAWKPSPWHALCLRIYEVIVIIKFVLQYAVLGSIY
jgi:hypothetical protein